jgi:hypothetical protein
LASELSRSQSQSASAHLLYSSSSILFEPATARFQDGNLTLWLMPGALLSAGVRYSFSVLLRNPMDRTAEAQVWMSACGDFLLLFCLRGASLH